MKRFKYKTLNSGKLSDEELKQLGEEGWQLVGIDTYNYPGPKYYFIMEKLPYEQ